MAFWVKFNAANDTVLYNGTGEDSNVFKDDPHAIKEPDLSAVAGVAQKYWKFVNGAIVSKTAQEISDQDAAEAAALLAFLRTAAKSRMTSSSDIDWRAIAGLIMDEINTLRQRDVDRSADVAAATSLADLKTRWAARSAFADRTLAQVKTTYTNKVDSGDAD